MWEDIIKMNLADKIWWSVANTVMNNSQITNFSNEAYNYQCLEKYSGPERNVIGDFSHYPHTSLAKLKFFVYVFPGDRTLNFCTSLDRNLEVRTQNTGPNLAEFDVLNTSVNKRATLPFCRYQRED
jgi:hypothetical protein